LLFIKCIYEKESGKCNGEMFKRLESKWLKKVNNEHAQKEYYKLFWELELDRGQFKIQQF